MIDTINDFYEPKVFEGVNDIPEWKVIFPKLNDRQMYKPL